MREATRRGEDLSLNEDEICFYEVLAMYESAVQAMDNAELKVIAAELVLEQAEVLCADRAKSLKIICEG